MVLHLPARVEEGGILRGWCVKPPFAGMVIDTVDTFPASEVERAHWRAKWGDARPTPKART